jgi:hypothetical protein
MSFIEEAEKALAVLPMPCCVQYHHRPKALQKFTAFIAKLGCLASHHDDVTAFIDELLQVETVFCRAECGPENGDA